MTDTISNAEIRVGVDGSDATAGLRSIEDAVVKTGKTLESLGATAKKAGKDIEDVGTGNGFAPVGEGAETAAGKVDRATVRMAESIKRATQATESLAAGAKGTAANFAALADMRGLNKNALKPLLDQLDAATQKANLAAEAQRKFDDSTKFLASLKERSDGIGKTASQLAEMRAAQLGVAEAAAPMIARMREAEAAGESWSAKLGSLAKDKLKGLAIAIAAAGAAAAAATALMLKSAIDDLGELDDLAQKTGASVENLSRIQKVVTVFGPDMESVNSALNKLAKGMATVDDESNKTHKALTAIGVASKDTSGKLRDPAEVLVDLAKKLQGYNDGAAKTALITDAVGKSGADLLPFLNDLAENFDKVAGVSADAASSAAKFQDQLGWMKLRSKELYTAIAIETLPTLNDLAGAFLDVNKSQKDLVSSDTKQWADDIAVGLARVADVAALIPRMFGSISSSFKVVAADLKVLGATAATANPVALGKAILEGRNPLEDVRKAVAERNQILADANTKYDALWNKPANQFEQALLKRMANRAKDAGAPAASTGAGETPDLHYQAGTDSSAAAAEAAIKKEAEAYAGLIASIRAKSDENRLELVTDTAATEAQKLRIKVDQELASGKLKLSDAHLATMRAALGELDATEELVKAQRAEKDSMAWMQQSAQARNALNDSLQVQYDLYGKSADARDIAMVAIKGETDLEKFLLDERVKGITIGEQLEAQLRAEKDMRVEVEQATLGQTKALGYANQLSEENKKFGLQYIADDKQRAAAQLALDSDVWKERIRLAGEGTEAQKRLQEEFDVWYRDQSAKPYLDEQKKMWQSIETTAHDTFVSIFDSGKSAFDRLRDTLKNGLLDLLYQMTIKKWIVNIGATATMGGAAGLAQAAAPTASAGGLVGLAQTASSLYSGLSGGLSLSGGLGSGFFGSIAGGLNGAGVGSGLTSSLGLQIGTSIANVVGPSIAGSISAGLGAAAAAAPWVAGAIAAYAIGKKAFGHGDTELASQGIRGTLSASGLSGQTYQNLHQDGGWFSSDRNWTDTKSLSADMAKQFTQGLSAIEQASSGFAQSLGVKADSIASYSKAFDIKLTGDATKDQQAVADFFNGVGDEIAKSLVPNLDTFSKSGESASAALQRLASDFDSTTTVAQLLGKTAAEAFGSAGIDSAASRERLVTLAGGTSTLTSQAQSYAQNYLTDDEKLAPVKKAVDEAMASLGLAAVQTRDQFKAIINSLDLTTEAGAKEFTSLLALSDAFAQVHAATDTAAADAKAAAVQQERQGLQDQLDQLTMTSVQLLGKQRDALDESNRSLFDQIQLSQKAKNAADERTGLQDQFDQLTMTSAQLLNKQRNALDESNRSLFDQIQALQGQAAAIQAVKDNATSVLGNVDDAYSVLQKVVGREKDALQARITAEQAAVSRLQDLSQSISSALDGMTVPGTEAFNRQAAQGQIQQALGQVKAGGSLSDDQIAGLKKAFSTVSQDASTQFGSYQDYMRDLLGTKNDVAMLGKATDDQLSVEQASLDQLQAQSDSLDAILTNAQDQIDTLKGISTTGLSIVDALHGLSVSIASARQNPIVSATQALTDTYKSALGRAPDAAGLAYYQDQIAKGLSVKDAQKDIENSPEAKAVDIRSLYQNIFHRNADDAGVSYWLGSGLSVDQIKSDFLKSDEYKKLHPFAVGTNFVPKTMPALLHEGERVIPAADNRALMARLSNPSENSAALVVELKALRSEVAGLRRSSAQTADNTGRHADMFDQATAGGGPLLVEVAQ